MGFHDCDAEVRVKFFKSAVLRLSSPYLNSSLEGLGISFDASVFLVNIVQCVIFYFCIL